MQCHRFFEFAEDGVAGGEAGDVRVVLSCPQVILADLVVIVLAGEHERIGDGRFALAAVRLAERRIAIAVLHIVCRIDNHSNAS